MALSSKLFTEESPGKPFLKRCSETHAGHFLRGMATNPGIKDAITRIQAALRQLGFTIADPAGVYGASTEAAVLRFKGPPRNILGPGQTKPDAIVGIQTIHALDAAVSSGPKPAPVVVESGSTNWSFTFFGDKGFSGKGTYGLDIMSSEANDSRRFGLNELNAIGDLVGGFRGQTRGRFSTPRKLNAKDFHGAISSLSIQKNRKDLRGFLQLSVSSKQFIVNLNFEPFQEQRVLGAALTSGTLLVSGQIVTK